MALAGRPLCLSVEKTLQKHNTWGLHCLLPSPNNISKHMEELIEFNHTNITWLFANQTVLIQSTMFIITGCLVNMWYVMKLWLGVSCLLMHNMKGLHVSWQVSPIIH